MQRKKIARPSAPVRMHYDLDIAPESIWIMATPDPSMKRSVPYVLELGDFFAGEKYYTRRQNLPSYLIKLTLSGAGRLEYNGHNEHLGLHRVFWIDCMQPQYYYTNDDEKNWRVLWVHFYGPTCQRYYEWFLAANNGSNTAELPVNTNISASIYKLIALYRDGDNSLLDDVSASALLTDIMAECIRATGKKKDRLQEMPVCIASARSYLIEHLNEPITLSDLSDMYSLDRFYFQKLFKRFIGLSPKKFQTLTRVNRAKELLQATDCPISEIAEMIGIENASRFISTFRTYEGLTPGAYREKWRGK